MPTTKENIRVWLQEGLAKGATHVIVMCDTFDWDDYPVYVRPGRDARTVAANHAMANDAKVMEVYNLKLDLEAQLSAHRAFNY